MIRIAPLALVLTFGLPLPALSQDGESQRSALSCAPLRSDAPPPALQRSADLPLQLDAQLVESEPGEPIRFRDDVQVKQGDQSLTTDELIYDSATGRIDIPGWLTYTDALIELEANSGWVVTEENRGRFDRVDYRFQRGEGSGSAGVVELLSETRAEVEGFDFTTCDPSDPDWELKASRVELDLDRGRGVARNARLDFKGVPIFYSPWLSFPLDDRRKSGFLYPRLGFSSDDGFDLSAPWYWNIAPNQDATFTPRWIQDRGAMLGAQHRFLTPRQSGQLDLEVLPDDREEDASRYFAQFEYTASLARRWRFDANLRRASDENYFLDLGGDLADSALQFLRSSATLRGSGRTWSMSLSADTFQVLDETVSERREPYRRLPRLQLNVDRPLTAQLDFRLDSEVVYFDRDEGVTGARMDLYPRLRYNWITPGSFLRPTIGFRSTAYELSGGDDDSLTRNLPIASLDGGLIFERALSNGRIQTLEPRLFYLYTPFRDQSDLPDFDTRELTFGFSQLFSDNRFSGPDRQGDANQLTAALTSRVIEQQNGRSLVDFSIGQIFYFRDLRVGLNGQPDPDRNRSATVAEVNWRPAQAIIASAGLEWDSEADETQVAQFGLSYRPQRGVQLALGYRFRRDRVDQGDLRFRIPVGDSLAFVGRANYSFADNEPLELLAGIEYESCCWAVRLIGRDYVRDRDADRRTAVFVELHLKGLGSLGRRPYPLFADVRY